MASLCKMCELHQNYLLEMGDGSQVVCRCVEEEEEDQLTISETQNSEDLPVSSSGVGASNQATSFDSCIADSSSSLNITHKSASSSASIDDTSTCNEFCSPVPTIDVSLAPGLKRKSSSASKLNDDVVGAPPSMKKQLVFPDEEEFDKLLVPWRDIEVNTTFHVVKIGTMGKGFNPYFAELISKNGENIRCWILSRIYRDLQCFNLSESNVFIKSLGLKVCKGDESKKFFDYRIISKERK